MTSRTWLALLAVCITLVVGLTALNSVTPTMSRPAPMSPGPAPVEPPDALLVVHGEWRAGASEAARSGGRCPEGALVDSEVEILRDALARIGFALFTAEVGELEPAAVAGYELVIHHNGGWGSSMAPAEEASLLAARAAGRPILFLGDDAATMALRSPEILRAMGVEEVVGNGRMGVALARPAHPGRITYTKDPDEVRLVPSADVRLLDELGHPVAWVVGRVAVGEFSVRSSDVCPVSDEHGTYALKSLVSDLVTAITTP